MKLNIEITADDRENGQIGFSVWKSSIATEECDCMGRYSRKLRAERTKSALPPSIAEKAEALEWLFNCILDVIVAYNASGNRPKIHLEEVPSCLQDEQKSAICSADLNSLHEQQHPN